MVSLGSDRVDIFGLDQVGPGPMAGAIRDDRLEVISLKKTIRYEVKRNNHRWEEGL